MLVMIRTAGRYLDQADCEDAMVKAGVESPCHLRSTSRPVVRWLRCTNDLQCSKLATEA